MESTEQHQQQSNSFSHRYYNIQNEIIEKNTKYGSFSANNHKHYKNKLISKSASNIPFNKYTQILIIMYYQIIQYQQQIFILIQINIILIPKMIYHPLTVITLTTVISMVYV